MSLTHDEVLDRLRDQLARLAPEIDIDSLEPDVSFWEIGIESVVAAELVAALEDDLRIVVPMDELIDVTTPAELAAVIVRFL